MQDQAHIGTADFATMISKLRDHQVGASGMFLLIVVFIWLSFGVILTWGGIDMFLEQGSSTACGVKESAYGVYVGTSCKSVVGAEKFFSALFAVLIGLAMLSIVILPFSMAMFVTVKKRLKNRNSNRA
jgi:hypothetical protein